MEAIKVLGPLCKNGHDVGDNQSLRYASTRQCVTCHAEWTLRRKNSPVHEADKATARESSKRYYHRNVETIRVIKAEYRKTESYQEAKAKSRIRNKVQLMQRTKDWKQTEKGKILCMQHWRKRAKLQREAKGIPYTKTDVVQLFALFDNLCVYCGSPANCVDHVLPISKMGKDEIRNMVPACRSCNNSKSAILVEAWFPKRASFTPERLERILNHLKV